MNAKARVKPPKVLIPLQEAVPVNYDSDDCQQQTMSLTQIAGLILVCLLIAGGITYCTHSVNHQPEYDSNK